MTAAKKGKRYKSVTAMINDLAGNDAAGKAFKKKWAKRRAWRPSRRAIYAAMQEWTPSADAWMLDKLVVSQMRRALAAAARVDKVVKP